MSARVFLTAAVTMATVQGASGQMGTADGVAALARGDYQRAVEILRPIAEDWGSDDAAAQFFMAGLYETGRGVPADPLRACALYFRAVGNYNQPFGRQATTLFAASISRGPEFNEECQLLGNVGFDHGFEPVTFHLGPGHEVEWTLKGATVTYKGQTKRKLLDLANPGTRFFPLRHTQLATGPTRALVRHFIEVFVWQPTRRSGPWNLQWHLFEIVRDQIVRIDTPDSLVTVEGDISPSRDAFDVREYAAVRVDDDGNTEWAVLKGPGASSERIETDAERRETRETEAARAAALKGVDWSKRSDVHRHPAMTYVDSQGCGFFLLVGWAADRDEAIVVRADAQDLGLSTGAATFDLSRNSSNISIDAYVYEAPQRHSNFCTDVIMREQGSIEPEVWRAVAGTVSIELSPPGIRARAPHLRRATVALTDMVLRNATGTTVRVSRPVRLTAIVGSMAR